VDRTKEIIELSKKNISKREIGRILKLNNQSVSYWFKKLTLKGIYDHNEEGHKGPKHYDIIGKTFGNLEVLALIRRNKRGSYYAVCRCLLCNNIKEILVTYVVNNIVITCGCRTGLYEKITGKNSSQYTGYEDLTGRIWGTIVYRASKRGYKMEVTKEYLWDLYLKQNKLCALSKVPIKFGRASYLKETTASLDRIDSGKGYVEGNVQWVFKDVNIMKNSLPQNYFIELCKKISKANNLVKNEETYEYSLFNRGRYTTHD